MKILPYYVGLSILGAGITSGVAVAQGSDPSIEGLMKRIEELEQEVRILGRKGELAGEAAAERAKTAASASVGSSGFQIRSGDTNFVLKVRGYLQADSRWYADDAGAGSAVNDTFLLRRVRPILEGTVYDKFDYRFMLDFGSGVTANNANNAYVQDAYLNARFWPQLQVQAGKFKAPVSLERLQSGANLLFIERSYPSQLLPNRDVGLQLHGSVGDGVVNYAVGVFNGVGDGGSGDIDRTEDEKDFAARIFVEPFKSGGVEALRGLGVGLAGTYGDHAGAPRSYTSPGQQSIFSYYNGSGTSPLTQRDGTAWRLSPQGYWYYKSFGLLGEYAISSAELVRTRGGAAPASGTLQNTAWQVAASWFLTGEENSFKAVTPKKPFKLGSEGWGAWEVAARVSQLKLDEETFPTFASDTTNAREAFSYGLGVNWHLNRNFKFSLNYERTDFEGGQANALLEKGENVILTRAQVSF